MTQTLTKSAIELPEIDVKAEQLVDKVVFLSINFNRFGVMRKCAVEVKSEATESRFAHQKKLLVSPELKAILKADNEIRARINLLALPHKDIAMYIIPDALLSQVYKILGEYKKTRPDLIEAFLTVYFNQVLEAQNELKEFFNQADYPTTDDMRAEFGFSYKIHNFGVPGHLKTVAPDIWEIETAKAQADLVEAAKGINDALAAAAHGFVEKLADMLSDSSDGKKKKIYGSHVEKLQEFLNTFSLRNVTDSKELEFEMGKLKSLMEGVDVEKIKHNDGLRLELQSKFKDAAASIGTLVTVKGRKFRDVE